jgi:hypothetical protein
MKHWETGKRLQNPVFYNFGRNGANAGNLNHPNTRHLSVHYRKGGKRSGQHQNREVPFVSTSNSKNNGFSQGRRKRHEEIMQHGSLRLRPKQDNGLHPFMGNFLPHPDSAYDGLVMTINNENMLDRMYVDKESHALKYGVRAEAQPHLTVPMKLVRSDDEHRLAFNGFEGFVAVAEAPGDRALYFDKSDNGLQGKVGSGTKVTEIEFVRVLQKKRQEACNIWYWAPTMCTSAIVGSLRAVAFVLARISVRITPRLCVSADPASGSRIFKTVLLSQREEGVMEEVEAKSEASGRRGSEGCQWLRQVWNK